MVTQASAIGVDPGERRSVMLMLFAWLIFGVRSTTQINSSYAASALASFHENSIAGVR
jgi:hypothetical protein